jgi:DNA polymerase III epsilon subunit-like protein
MDTETSWIILDTETNGLSAPIYVVDIAAQKMKGWEPDGKPFRALLNQNIDIPPEASRVNGYTREILERDGERPIDVYDALRAYAEDGAIVSYNLEFDYDKVLLPEWARLRITPIGKRGFCALRLAQRLLDPVPAGNHKLQTLRQFYRLPERGAHSALGDVLTVIDLFQSVLRPICEQRHLETWNEIQAFCDQEWFPTRLVFGKFKGRSFREARYDQDLRGWLEWLNRSSNPRTARMGEWYLARLEEPEPEQAGFTTASATDTPKSAQPAGEVRKGIVIFHNLQLEELRHLVTAARERLADLEVIYARESNAVAVTQAELFSLLKHAYLRRDNLRLVVSFRRRYIESLAIQGESEAERIQQEFWRARLETEEEYREAEEAAASQKTLTEDQQAELKGLFRKLVRLFHPDRHIGNADAYRAYTILTQEIMISRDNADIEKLREIAADPEGYARRLGLGELDFSEESELGKLQRLYEGLQAQILEMLEIIDKLRADPKYEFSQLAARRPGYLKEVAAEYESAIKAECDQLEAEAESLALEIEELTGSPAPRI